jgi:hypothetical protein
VQEFLGISPRTDPSEPCLACCAGIACLAVLDCSRTKAAEHLSQLLASKDQRVLDRLSQLANVHSGQTEVWPACYMVEMHRPC